MWSYGLGLRSIKLTVVKMVISIVMQEASDALSKTGYK